MSCWFHRVLLHDFPVILQHLILYSHKPSREDPHSMIHSGNGVFLMMCSICLMLNISDSLVFWQTVTEILHKIFNSSFSISSLKLVAPWDLSSLSWCPPHTMTHCLRTSCSWCIYCCHIFPFLNYWFNCYSKGSSMTWKSSPAWCFSITFSWRRLEVFLIMVFHSADSLMLQLIESPWPHKGNYVTYNQKAAAVMILEFHFNGGEYLWQRH